MQKKSLNRVIIISILVIGAILRLTLFFVSPPNNSFDDHLEVVNIYANTLRQPLASQCWECYQPPMYYTISAAIYKVISYTNTTSIIAWKFVQLINPILSIIVLILYHKLLLRFSISDTRKILYLSFIAVLPIDLFTSSMIGNDYFLVFASVVSFFYFLKSIDDINSKEKTSYNNFVYLSIFVLIGCLSKQHGLLLLIFPSIIMLILFVRKVKITYFTFSAVYILLIILSFSNEFSKYKQTGRFIVSNQDFYDYAVGQFPGSLENVEFTSFRIYSLLQKPFISNQTAASFPTEIFARTFFDYEWRFLSPNIPFANIVGRLAYILGILWIIYFLGTLFSAIWKRKQIKFQSNTHKILIYTPILVGILFFTVPFIQTLRYPYFSSMKATFALPGIIILLITHAYFIRRVKLSDKICFLLSFLNISYGVFLIYSIYSFMPFTVNHLSGPLWPIP
ncbi:hypothetical protein [Flavobacterium sp. W22_SRS_FP1]|uniref:hypothetical protein n=1 Tax=Flavobacterium sp. W22_SRS_FP1 TaxID=3240276 RepID=UPI003F922A80